MPFGMEVGLGPGDCVRWELGYPRKREPPPRKPIFGPCLLWPNGWMDQVATCYGGKRRLRRRLLDVVAAPLKGAQPPPSFRFMSIVARRLDG